MLHNKKQKNKKTIFFFGSKQIKPFSLIIKCVPSQFQGLKVILMLLVDAW